MNPYGTCHHTKYEGCPPCVHSAWEAGVQAAYDAVDKRWETIPDAASDWLLVALAAIDALKGGSDD